MRKRTLNGIFMVLVGVSFVFVDYYIAILPNDWTYRRGMIPVIGIILMFLGLMGIIFDQRKAHRRRKS